MLDCLSKIRQGVEARNLTVLEATEEYQYGISEFLQLPAKPPLPDIIFVKVSCNACNKKSSVFVDWYHAQGEISRINT
jgi:hypothetical protein